MSSILFSVHCHCLPTLIKAIDSVGDPPLPIPNREVKPDSADGTANVCGRVGHRHFFLRSPGRKSGASFFVSIPIISSGRWYCRCLWESSGLEALLCKPKGSVVATNAPPRWHRHFYRKRALVNTKARFFIYTSVKNLFFFWRCLIAILASQTLCVYCFHVLY